MSLPPVIYDCGFIFCRIAASFALIPGIGEGYVLARWRLFFALAVSFVLSMPLRDVIPVAPANPIALGKLVLIEIVIGVFIGFLCRLMTTITHIAGGIIASQSGLGVSQLLDPGHDSHGSIEGNLLGLFGMFLLFVTNLHHPIIKGLGESYHVLPPGDTAFLKDIANYTTRFFADTLQMAFKIAAPNLVVSVLVFISCGILSRLLPSIQIFFWIFPLQITLSFTVLMLSVSSILLWYIEYMHESVSVLLLKVPKNF
jgi:flagellar biosynthetic protein FliR